MISAHDAAKKSAEAIVKNTEEICALCLAQIDSWINKAAEIGETSISDIFIGHKKKAAVVNYLQNKGYKVTELKMGNTFKISWGHL